MLINCKNVMVTNDITLLPSNDGIARVYEIIKNGVVVYVGKSVNMYTRFAMHKHMRGDNNYMVRFGECELGEILEVEAANIVSSNPTENMSVPKNNLYVRKEDAAKVICDEFGIMEHADFVNGYGTKYYNVNKVKKEMAAKLLIAKHKKECKK